jgi:hypothetical protein
LNHALRGKAHRAKQALTAQGSTPIYGYKFVDGEKYKKERYAPNTDPIATVDGEIWTEVRVIEYCFTQLLKGMSTYQIALSLTRMGIPTQRKRVGWNRLTIRKKNNGEILVIKSSYQCYINKGVEQQLHHHYLECSVERADREAWDFAIQFIKNPTRVREHIESMKGKVIQRNHSQDLEKGIAILKKSIANLWKLAEAADPDDEDGMRTFQERLIALQKDKQEKEKLLAGISDVEDKQEKLLEALDRFEKWAEAIRPFVDDPTYMISQEDKIAVIRVLGVRVKIFPTEKTAPNRIECDMFPPDVERYCDGDFGQLLSGQISSRSIIFALCL